MEVWGGWQGGRGNLEKEEEKERKRGGGGGGKRGEGG